MALIPKLTEIQDLVPITDVDGREFDLRIIAAKEQKSKNTGRFGVMIVYEIVDEDLATNVIENLWFGNYKSFTLDDDEKSETMWRMVKNYIRKIGLDPDEDLEPEDFIGLEIVATLIYNDGTNEDGEQEFAPKNEIGRIL